MKMLFVGDSHLKIGNFETSKEFLRLLKEKAEELHPDVVLIAGDLLDSHAIIRSEVMNLWIDYFESMSIPHIALVGNHDLVGGTSRVHALSAFKKFIKVVDAPYVFGGCDFLPYASNAEFASMVKEANNYCRIGEKTILFCHQTIDGAVYENGMYAPDGFPLSMLSEFKLVISGHIHKAQRFANVWYPGSPFHQSFNDAGEKKCLYMLDTVTLQAQSVELGLPEYFLWQVPVNEVVSQMQGIVDNGMAADHFKFMVKGTKTEITALQNSMEFRSLHSKLRLVLCPEYTDAVVLDDRISDSVTPEKMVDTYIRDIMKTDLDRGKLVEMSIKLLHGEDV